MSHIYCLLDRALSIWKDELVRSTRHGETMSTLTDTVQNAQRKAAEISPEVGEVPAFDRLAVIDALRADQANEARPGLGIYLAFIPWIVFSVAAQHSTLKLAAVSALLTSVLIAARSIRAGAAKLIELGTVLAFVGFTVVAFRADPATGAFVARYARAIAAALLAAIAFGSLLVTPFTEQYARESVPRQLWSSPQFKHVNRQLTTMWGLVFAAMVPAHVIAGALDTHRANLIFNWAIPIAIVMWAAERTARVGDSAKASPSTDTGAAIAIDRNPTSPTTAETIAHGEVGATLRRSK